MGAGQKRPRPDSTSDGNGLRSGSPSTSNMNVFRPPVLRSVATATASLNKALFTKTFEIAAARVHDNRLIAKYQKALTSSREILRADRLAAVVDDPEASTSTAAAAVPTAPGQAPVKPPGKRKCLLLHPSVSPSAPETWSDVIKQGVERNELGLFPYKLTLDYDYWTSREVLVSVLPEEFHDDIPAGFNTAGHIAHLNLRDRFKPYKYIVAQVLLDKNPQLRTVINKTDLVGTESAFRTFPYEVLAGPDDMDVEVRENMCNFRFDYSKVYWNSKLETEHSRLLYLFKPGEVVVDLMAGIGPFAVPAGKRGVFVWANDMNPESFAALSDAIQRNKVSSYVRPFNEDGLVFIHRSADLVAEAAKAGGSAVEVTDIIPASRKPAGSKPTTASSVAPAGGNAKGAKKHATSRRRIYIPPTISHFVMNLPASAITFLPRFRGLYDGREYLFKSEPPVKNKEQQAAAAADDTDANATADASAKENVTEVFPKLPIIHVHCFAAKDDDQSIPKRDVCERVSAELGVQMTLCSEFSDVEQDDPLASTPKNLVYVYNVRAVAPHKSMFCASFRLPASVAFAPRNT